MIFFLPLPTLLPDRVQQHKPNHQKDDKTLDFISIQSDIYTTKK